MSATEGACGKEEAKQEVPTEVVTALCAKLDIILDPCSENLCKELISLLWLDFQGLLVVNHILESLCDVYLMLLLHEFHLFS